MRKRPCHNQCNPAPAPTTVPEPTVEREPENRMRFTGFQMLLDADGQPWVIALGVDGRLYSYNWVEEIWDQSPDQFTPDREG